MSLVTEKPEGIPTGNDLDQFADQLDGPVHPAEIYLASKCLTVLEDPPGPHYEVVLMVRLKVHDLGTRYNEDDTEIHYRKTRLVAARKPGTSEPKSGDDQPGLYEIDDDGAPIPDPGDVLGDDGGDVVYMGGVDFREPGTTAGGES